MRPWFIIFASLLSCSSLATASTQSMSENNELTALHLDWLNPAIAPSENFYGYANRTWQQQHPIPAEYPSWSTFSVLQEKNQALIHQMLIDASLNKKAAPGSIEQKIGDFYFSGMDEASINKLGATPLQSEFARIQAIQNQDDLQAALSHLHQIGVDACFSFGSMQDFKDSTQMIGAIVQSGLSLPDRDYYLKKDNKFKQIRTAFISHMTNMFLLLGDDPNNAAKQANTIMNIETQLAQASMSRIEERDPHAIYHMVTVPDLNKLTPNFSWSRYFASMGQQDITRVNLAMPEFIKTTNQLFQTIPLNDWKTYLRWHLLDAFAPYLSHPFVLQNFHMNAVLTGTTKLLPRWKRVVNTENAALGFAIGELYVKRYVSPQTKSQALAIIHAIRQSLKDDLQTLTWMSPPTRQAALKKLDSMEDRVGYPDKWRDYSSLVINKGPYVLNILRANQYLVKRDLDKIGKPIDRTEWDMPPQTINAYYNPSMNNINIPAGILQPPFFDPTAPMAVNFGAIGFVIGHEMTHGFDDQGAKFDGQGNLNNWWTTEDSRKFQAATNCIVKQFSQYKSAGLPLQGKLVVGEATADLGGLTLAYHAFISSNAYKNAKTIQGFTPAQQFFLGAAHVWASNIRPEQARNLVTVDPHPPAVNRVNGTVANMPAFQAAFDIPASSPMVNRDRCVIW